MTQQSMRLGAFGVWTSSITNWQARLSEPYSTVNPTSGAGGKRSMSGSP